jgi:arginine:pyruvate transaminase
VSPGSALPPPRLSSLAGRIEEVAGGSWRVHRLARERVAAGRDVIVLSLGEPDFPPPDPAVEAAVSGLRAGRTRYTYARGEPAALEAVAHRASQQAGRPVATERVVFFPGSQAALFATMLCLVEEGDEVILGEPAYSTYPGVLAAAGATSVEVPLRPEDGFHLRVADLAAAITPRTRAVLLNSPHNPSGAVATADELEGAMALCREHGLWLVVDEVYASLTWARPHVSVLALDGAEELAVSLGSVSKSHAMTGFRFGWAVAPVELAARLERLLEAMLFGSPAFVQDAGAAALADGRTTAFMQEAYERRARLFCAALEGSPGLLARTPEGGMFVLVDVRGTGLSGDDFALRLLEEADVAVTPVDGFGPSGTGHVRVSLGAEDALLAEAARRIARLASELAQPPSRPVRGQDYAGA